VWQIRDLPARDGAGYVRALRLQQLARTHNGNDFVRSADFELHVHSRRLSNVDLNVRHDHLLESSYLNRQRVNTRSQTRDIEGAVISSIDGAFLRRAIVLDNDLSPGHHRPGWIGYGSRDRTCGAGLRQDRYHK